MCDHALQSGRVGGSVRHGGLRRVDGITVDGHDVEERTTGSQDGGEPVVAAGLVLPRQIRPDDLDRRVDRLHCRDVGSGRGAIVRGRVAGNADGWRRCTGVEVRLVADGEILDAVCLRDVRILHHGRGSVGAVGRAAVSHAGGEHRYLHNQISVDGLRIGHGLVHLGVVENIRGVHVVVVAPGAHHEWRELENLGLCSRDHIAPGRGPGPVAGAESRRGTGCWRGRRNGDGPGNRGRRVGGLETEAESVGPASCAGGPL